MAITRQKILHPFVSAVCAARNRQIVQVVDDVWKVNAAFTTL
jgi:hypothetical protein